MKKLIFARTYLNERFFKELKLCTYLMNRKLNDIPSDEKRKRKLIKEIKEAKDHYKNYNSTIDEELFSSLEMYYYNVPKNQHPSVFKRIEQQLFGFKALDLIITLKMFLEDQFSSKEKFLRFLKILLK